MGATQSKTNSYLLETQKGKLKGIEQKDLEGNSILQRYTKIPYALPPTGKLRWRRPQPLPSDFSFSTKSGEPGDYTKFGPICPQPEYGHGAAQLDNPANAPEIENVQSEDCLYLNIWVPAGTPPASGWPVQFHIHGGWLQVGDANQSNSHDPYDLFTQSTPRIIVAPTYRLNLFGFLAGKDLAEAESAEQIAGNYGLWDQRAALEWVHANIGIFGGNPDLITVGGLSAGSHSAFIQLYHDTYLPADRRLIKQVYFWSNAIAIQPNPTTSQILTDQYRDLCDAVGIQSTNTSERLSALRSLDSEELVDAIFKLKMHTFRTSTDNDLVPTNFLQTLHDGTFTSKLAANGIRVILGEVCDEALLYKLVNPPNTHEDLLRQLANYYPKSVVDKLMDLSDIYEVPQGDSAENQEKYEDVFASIVADMQVHAAVRGLTRALVAPPGGVKSPEVMRYRIAWRAKGLDGYIAPEVGVCHAADTPIWWMSGYRGGYEATDTKAAVEFLKPFGEFLEGKAWTGGVAQRADGANKIGRYLDEKGVTHEDVEDKLWDRAMKVWDAVAEAQGIYGLKHTLSTSKV